MRPSRVLAAIALSFALATPSMAQLAPSPVRQAVEEAFRLRDREAWDELTGVVHPEALERFRKDQLEFAQLDELSKVRGDSTPSFLRMVFRVNDRAGLEALSSEKMLERWVRVAHRKPRRQSNFVPPTVTRTILGEVAEGDSVVHVVFREVEQGGSYGGETIPARDKVRLVTVKLAGARWKIFLNGGIVYEQDGMMSIAYGDDDEKDSKPK